MDLLEVSRSKAYGIIKELNEELAARGYRKGAVFLRLLISNNLLSLRYFCIKYHFLADGAVIRFDCECSNSMFCSSDTS